MEVEAIKWGLRELCPGLSSEQVASFGSKEGFSQTDLTGMFTKHNMDRLPKTIAASLLYCGRYEDTTIIESVELPHLRAMVINMENYPMVEIPIGKMEVRVRHGL